MFLPRLESLSSSLGSHVKTLLNDKSSSPDLINAVKNLQSAINNQIKKDKKIFMNLDNNFMNIYKSNCILKNIPRLALRMLLPIILALVILLPACDPGSTINYSILNKTDGPLTVKYQFAFTSSKDTSIKKTTIMANSSKLLNSENVLGYVDRVVKARDSICLYKLIIIQGNSAINKNYKDKKYWKFNKTNEQLGTYSIVVN